MTKPLFGNYPEINAQFGKTFGVIPPGLTGDAKAAAEKIVEGAIEGFNSLEKTVGTTLGEKAILGYVATSQLAMSSAFQVLNGWVNAKNY